MPTAVTNNKAIWNTGLPSADGEAAVSGRIGECHFQAMTSIASADAESAARCIRACVLGGKYWVRRAAYP